MVDDILGTELVTEGGALQPTSEAMNGIKYIGLYFGAHWAPCCRRYTDTLKSDY